MKKFYIILAAVLQAAIAGAQQVDTTGCYSERRDTLKAAAVTVRRDLVTADADKLTYNVQADPKAEEAISSTFLGTCRCSASTERIRCC